MTAIKTVLAGLALAFAAGASAGPVNINTADAPTLEAELKGVGSVIAERIVNWRKQHGAFDGADQLVQVRGVGAKTLERNRSDILVD